MSPLALAGLVIILTACTVLVCLVAFLLWREGRKPLPDVYAQPFGDVPRIDHLRSGHLQGARK